MAQSETRDHKNKTSPPARRIKRRFIASSFFKVSIIMLALGLALFPLPAAWIERFYSNGLYPKLQAALTPLTNLLPFALADLLIAGFALGLPLWWIMRIRSAGRGHRLKAVAALSFNLVVLVAVLFLSFQMLWGFNYLRKPLPLKLEYDEQALTSEAITELTRTSIEQLNSLSAEARSNSWPDEEVWRSQLHDSFDNTVKQLGNDAGIAAAIPKRSLLNFYLAAAGIEGFVNPFGHEVILDSELLPFEKPFLVAHEWSHLAGFADESEASFAGLLACLHSSSVALRYSGWLALYQHLPRQTNEAGNESGSSGSTQPLPKLVPEVVADLRAISERVGKHINASISKAQAEVYDRFLKANRVEAGIASYNLLVRLVVSTRFEQGWVPVLRNGALNSNQD